MKHMILFILMGLYTFFFGYEPKKDLHGSARKAKKREVSKVLHPNHNGQYVANNLRLTLEESFKHFLLAAPTGQGKSTKFSAVNLLQLYPNCSLVCLDPSGELQALSEGYLQQQGFDIKTFDLEQVVECFNPCVRADSDDKKRELSQLLIQSGNGDSSHQNADPFWTNKSTSIVLLILKLLDGLEPEKRTLHMVYHLLNKYEVDREEMDALAQRILDDTAFYEYAAFGSSNEKTRQSVLSTAQASLYSFSHGNLKDITASDTLNFQQLRQTPTVLFIRVNPLRVRYVRQLVSIFYTQLLEFLSMHEGLPVYMLMDEFATAAGRIPNIIETLATIRKKKVSLSIIVQNLGQLEHIYGKAGAQTILSNCNSKLFYSGLDYDSSDYVSKMMGAKTVAYVPEDSPTQQYNYVSRRLMNPDEVTRIRKDQAIFLTTNHYPMLLESVKPFYEVNKLIKRTKIKKQ